MKKNNWNFSNLKKHMKRHENDSKSNAPAQHFDNNINTPVDEASLGRLLKQENQSTLDNNPIELSYPERNEKTPNTNSLTIDNTMDASSSKLSFDQADSNTNQVKSVKNNTNEFNDADVDFSVNFYMKMNETIVSDNTKSFDDLKTADIMYAQFSAQNLLLIEAALKHSEHARFMPIKCDERVMNINILNVKGDGQCMFLSSSHQLECVKVDSEDHNRLTTNLRKNVVKQIVGNVERYRQALKFRFRNKGNEDLDGACKEFVSTDLVNESYWGGSESLLAISDIHNVNILVFRENGPFYLATGFNPEYERTIFLAYRGTVKKDGTCNYDHYDTVCGIGEELLYKCANDLAKKMNTSTTIN